MAVGCDLGQLVDPSNPRKVGDLAFLWSGGGLGGLVFLKAWIISGKHSDQGSMISEIRQDIRSRKKISEHPDRVLAQNVVLDVVVI